MAPWPFSWFGLRDPGVTPALGRQPNALTTIRLYHVHVSFLTYGPAPQRHAVISHCLARACRDLVRAATARESPRILGRPVPGGEYGRFADSIFTRTTPPSNRGDNWSFVVIVTRPSSLSSFSYSYFFLLHCALAAAQCIVIGPVCGRVCVFVWSVTAITENCVNRSSPNWVCR